MELIQPVRARRWLSRDPYVDIDGNDAELAQGANLYWYVFNNAVNRVDPTGLIAPSCETDGPDCPDKPCTWVCTCPVGTYLDGLGNTIFTLDADCDNDPSSRFPEKCNKKSSYRTIIIVGLGILVVAGAVATAASFGGFAPAEAGIIGLGAAAGL
jgi:hypothetical protein